jgi:hypothetical protein
MDIENRVQEKKPFSNRIQSFTGKIREEGLWNRAVAGQDSKLIIARFEGADLVTNTVCNHENL